MVLGKRYKIKLICVCLLLLFLLCSSRFTQVADFVSHSEGYSSESAKNQFLERHLLFHKSPPNVRETAMKMFGDEDLVDLLDLLLSKKLRKEASQPTKRSDSFEFHRDQGTQRISSDRTFHFGFVGDSRIRQLFAMIYQLIPNYDLTVYPEQAQFTGTLFIPRQMIIYSELLSSIVSFHWFNILVETKGRDIFKFFYGWLNHENLHLENNTLIVTPLPDILVIGLGTHHMLQEYRDAHEDVYFNKLQELVPLLQNMSRYCQIIWLNQYPTQEFFGKAYEHNTDVHSKKIWHYNQKANKIVSEAGIPIWNSGGPIAEEYFRSCLFNPRMDGYSRNYFNCKDYIHPGLAALVDIMQILYNLVLPK